MKNFFKKYFIPHQGNNWKPHFLREANLLALSTLVVAIFTLSVAGQIVLRRVDLTALVLPKVLVDYANKDRQERNFHSLTISPVLEKAAQLKANDMASKAYFAHKSPEGKTPWYWFGEAGYDFSYAGENLAVNFTDSGDVNSAWMNSPGHRENILNGNFTEIGIATAEGNYGGKSTTFVVQLFGRPAAKEIVTSGVPQKTLPKTGNEKPTTQKIITVTASTSVLGASGENELYIAVEKKSATVTEEKVGKYSNWLEELLISPKKVMSLIYLILAVIIVLSLTLFIFIEIERQNPKNIIMAVVVLFLMFSLLYLYKSVIFSPTLVI